MNVQLAGTEEFIDGKSTGSLGQVLIRYVVDQEEDRIPRCNAKRGGFDGIRMADSVAGVTTFSGYQAQRVQLEGARM